MTNKTTFVVACPAYFNTGGIELLHQLAKELENQGKNVYIYYLNAIRWKSPLLLKYKEYQTKYFIRFPNALNNVNTVLIIPEASAYLAKSYPKNVRKIIWWLSVDNYSHGPVKRFLNFLLHGCHTNYKLNPQENIQHLCQSHYAIDFLQKSGVPNSHISYLSDYVNKDYLGVDFDKKNKDNIVVYNPKKGYTFTKKLIERNPDIDFIPIQNLSRLEVKNLLLRAKVYIDFGNHPGKDRIPREAALCGCCIITSKNGSAKFKEDVNIPDKYKFEDSDKEIAAISKRIKKCFESYPTIIKDFEEYRKTIKKEKAKFQEDVKIIFN